MKKDKEQIKETKKPKDPLAWFFSLGDKVTRGDPKRKADWDFYMLWIIFLAFLSILTGNLYNFFFVEQSLVYLGWSFVMLGILWFQYNGLKQFYGIRKMLKEQAENPQPQKEMKIESVDEMLEEFGLDKDGKPTK